MLSAEEFLKQAITQGGRIVSSGDLSTLQIAEAQAFGKFWVNDAGFGFAILPWELTTDKDREREKAFFTKFPITPSNL